ncbi:MAG: class I SAM-dependent methyltransferase [Bacteroidetes bacterium]|nr:class I SAM-dependent methyltransferase [Bacteroidota bacterium]MDA1267981.1 class I SAM-dependent methyltransferase [Bacteroidota bacterium]
MEIDELNRLLGNADNYLLDQILKGRFTKEMKILDVGCGEGRNAVYFLQKNYPIFGIDPNEVAIQYCRYLAKTIDPQTDIHRFQVGDGAAIPFHAAAFEAVISSAVLHFAESSAHFWKMVAEIHRILKPGGIFWMRMNTGFGKILEESSPLGDGKYLLPDNSERYLLLPEGMQQLERMGFQFLEAPKTVLVYGQREMGVFLMGKKF